MKRLPDLTEQELQVLAELLNAGLKAIGIEAAAGAAVLWQKIKLAEDVENDSGS